MSDDGFGDRGDDQADGSSDDGFSPVLAIPFGSIIGAMLGLLVGVALLDGNPLGIVAGSGLGLLVGVVVFALLSRADDDGPPPAA